MKAKFIDNWLAIIHLLRCDLLIRVDEEWPVFLSPKDPHGWFMTQRYWSFGIQDHLG